MSTTLTFSSRTTTSRAGAALATVAVLLLAVVVLAVDFGLGAVSCLTYGDLLSLKLDDPLRESDAHEASRIVDNIDTRMSFIFMVAVLYGLLIVVLVALRLATDAKIAFF